MQKIFVVSLTAVVMLLATCSYRTDFYDTFVFSHVNVIDTSGGPVLADMTVVVRDGKIADVSKIDAALVPGHVKLVDGRGKYLIPGLWDMHVHTNFGEWVPPDEKVTLPFVANGVTGVRDMGGELAVLKRCTKTAQIAPFSPPV